MKKINVSAFCEFKTSTGPMEKKLPYRTPDAIREDSDMADEMYGCISLRRIDATRSDG